MLFETQKNEVIKMLNLNVCNTQIPGQTWKVLIFDKLGQDIISPLLKVNELRDNGITIHMSINTNRQPIPDVPAVYFIDPTGQNIEKLKQDFQKNLYETYYINFCKSISRTLLEELASYVVQFNVSAKIAQVFDQHLNFVCLDHDLFTLQQESSYQKLNNPLSKDHEINALVDDIVIALFSVISTLNVIPTIKCTKGNAAEMVAKKLDTRLRDYISNSKSLDHTLERPCLLVLDRVIDLQTMVSHAWTYAAMIHDLLGLNQNRVTIKSSKNSQKYDIDVNDFFWLKNASFPFPTVADNVNLEIIKYKEDVEKVTKMHGVNSLDEMDNSNTEHLKTAITAMPQLQERKRIIDMHMSLAMSLMELVKTRQIDHFFSIEESILKQTTTSVCEILKDSSKSQEDRLRLALIFLTNFPTLKNKDKDDIERVLLENQCDTRPFKYLRQLASVSKLATNQSTLVPPTSNTANDLFEKFTSIGSKLTDHLQQAGVSSGLESFISTVKNLLPSRKELPLTKLVHSLTENTQENHDILHFDPLTHRGKVGKEKPLGNQLIVFCVGGGSYLEYQNLIESASQNDIKVIYGATDLPKPSDFVAQLAELVQN